MNEDTGSVNLSISEYERLREIERAMPCVKILSDRWGHMLIQYSGENAVIADVKNVVDCMNRDINRIASQLKEAHDEIKRLTETNETLAVSKKYKLYRFFRGMLE